MRNGYSDVNWFLRAARVVPVIAAAALLGGMIGGFAMFAIDSALTWEPVWQPRPDARADNQASAMNQQNLENQQNLDHKTLDQQKPVRIVGGAIPDPSAGMSAPPPAPQQRAATPAQSQISLQLLTSKPLGPASQLQPQITRAGAGAGASQPQNQTANQAQTPQAQAPAQASTATPQQTRWPDALSRAHQNAANATSAQQQNMPPPAAAQASERATNKNGETERKEINGERRRDARNYDRIYDSYGNRRQQSYRNAGGANDDQSYGNRRQRSYGTTREQSYGDVGEDRDDNGYRSDASRSDTRHNTRYRTRSRVITREQPNETDRAQRNQGSQGNQANQGIEAGRQRSEPFWGGGFFHRGEGDQDNN